MPRFAANLSTLFPRLPFLERFDAAARVGFEAVEFPYPKDVDAEDLAKRLEANGLTQALLDIPSGQAEHGEHGLAVSPHHVNRFRMSLLQAVACAKRLNCKQLNCPVGVTPDRVNPADLRKTLIANLKYAARVTKEEGMTLLVEPMDDFDRPGFYLTGTAQALDIIEEVGADNLKILFDIAHMQAMEGNLSKTIENNLDSIHHIQIADYPGRAEPGTGEINFEFLLGRLDDIGFDGWIGCEFVPNKPGTRHWRWFKRSSQRKPVLESVSA